MFDVLTGQEAYFSSVDAQKAVWKDVKSRLQPLTDLHQILSGSLRRSFWCPKDLGGEGSYLFRHLTASPFPEHDDVLRYGWPLGSPARGVGHVGAGGVEDCVFPGAVKVVNDAKKERRDGDDCPRQTDIDAEGLKWLVRGSKVLSFLSREENAPLKKSLLQLSLVEVPPSPETLADAQEGGWGVDNVHVRFHDGVVVTIDSPSNKGEKERILVSYRPVLLRKEVKGVVAKFWAGKEAARNGEAKGEKEEEEGESESRKQNDAASGAESANRAATATSEDEPQAEEEGGDKKGGGGGCVVA
jgi:hypothetical protein